MRKWAMRFILLIKVYKISNDVTRNSTKDFCLYYLLKVDGIRKEMDKELHRELLLIFLIRSVWKQWGN